MEAKLNMFADDNQVINKSEQSIEESFRIFNIYEKASGAKMNLDKTVGMHLGKWKRFLYRFFCFINNLSIISKHIQLSLPSCMTSSVW
jgi:hypothetical protein